MFGRKSKPAPATLVPLEKRPQHIAVIMDGNGRWANRRGLPRIEGHRRGADTVRRIIEDCGELGIRYLTLYCFSSENWKRPQEELDLLMKLLEQYLVAERPNLIKNQVRLRVIGRRDPLPDNVLREMDTSIALSAEHTGLTLCLAINYGGRLELVDAVKRVAGQVQQGNLALDEIDEQHIIEGLYAPDIPDPDLMIRTSGEMRISNFLLWQLSYSELWVTPKTWPEFGRLDLIEAMHAYANRDRRFGGLSG